jgi:hypothetical protein
MEMIMEGGLMKSDLVKPLLGEANEIVAIMTSSRKTTSANQLLSGQGTRGRSGQLQIKNQKSKI